MNSIARLVRRAIIRASDVVRYWTPLSDRYAWGRRLLLELRYPRGIRSLETPEASEFFAIARRAHSPRLRRQLRASIRPAVEVSIAAGRAVVRGRPVGPLREVSGVLLLKGATPEEPGVLFAGNESSWPQLAAVGRETDLLARYELVGLSAWSPPDFRKFALFAGASPRRMVVGISNVDDLQAYGLLGDIVEPLPIMASDWLNPNDFVPRDAKEKDVDIVMVAGWGRYKRHWLLFDALRRLPRSLRVVLIGANSQGRTERDVRAEARLFGVRQPLEFHTALPVREANDWQARARVSVIFSGREGACLAITESMMADTPVGVMRHAHVGASRHINDSTGMLFDRSRVSTQLGALLERASTFTPRRWLMENASSAVSSARLNDYLATRARDDGRPWRTPVVPIFRRYFRPRYVDPSDAVRFLDELNELQDRYGLILHPPGE